MKLAQTPVLSPGGLKELKQHDWPENVRELENLIERAMIINPHGCLTFDQLLRPVRANNHRDPFMNDDRMPSFDEVNRRHIQEALSISNGKINGPGGAAELPDIYPSTLRRRMEKLGVVYGKRKKYGN